MDFCWFLPADLLWLPLAACALDLCLGDPRALPHPVNLVGSLLSLLERPLLAARKFRRTAGCIALFGALAATFGAAALLLNLPGRLFPAEAARFVGGALALYLSYAGLALGCLLREGEKARRAIDAAPDPAPGLAPDLTPAFAPAPPRQLSGRQATNAGPSTGEPAGKMGVQGPFSGPQSAGPGVGGEPDATGLAAARQAVAMLVSRDVSRLGKKDLYRTLAESLSENFNDAFVAPFFWLLLGGPLGLWLYKCASTADSRWGYRHEPWGRSGWAAARLDDVLAFVPARISAFLLYLSRLGRLGAWPGRAAFKADALQMESPNAGWSMAAAAWLHGAAMGGPAVYAGKLKHKPRLGPAGGEWDSRKIGELLRHLRLAGICGALLLWALFVLAVFLIRAALGTPGFGWSPATF